TTEGDPNPFAFDERRTFGNMSLVYPTVAFRTIPQTMLGGGAVWVPRKETIAILLAGDSEGKTTTTGFDTVQHDGTTVTAMVTNTTGLFGLPGGQWVGGTWSNSDYTSFSQDARFPILGVLLRDRPLTTGTNSWSVWLHGWQYAQTWEGSKDLGWGVFWR